MPVEERLQQLGSWGLQLSEDTPDSVRSQLGPFGRVAVVDGDVDVDSAGDVLLTRASYVGVLLEHARTLHPGGAGMVRWLGDQDGKGMFLRNKVTFDSDTLATVVDDLLAPFTAVEPGVVYPQADAAKRYSGEHQFTDVRTVLASVTPVFGAEFRVNGDATLDVGTPAQLYGSTPAAVIKRKGAGADLDIVGVGGGFDPTNDYNDYSTGVVLLGQTQDDHTIVTAVKDAVGVPFLDPHGHPVNITRAISESGETAGTVEQRAQLKLNEFYRAKQAVTLDLSEYETDLPARPGQYVWVFDPDTGLVDAANEVYFRGEVLHPVLERVSAARWAVREGMTVAFRTDAGAWVDLTRWVVWEDGDDELVVGDSDGLLTPRSNTVQDRIDSTRGGGAVNNVAPKPPTGLSLSTDAELDSAGVDVSRIFAEWTAPTQNIDETLLTDLAHFTVQFKRPLETVWAETTTADVKVALPVAPGLDYQVRVRAVDSDGQASAWTGVATIESASDSTAPPTPSDPQVSNYLGQLRIEWDGKDSTGQPMPADLNRVEVHVGTASGFTPTAATKVDEFTSGTRAVAYATAPYGVTRWVRLQAYDHQGNASGVSGSVSGSTAQVVSADVFDGAIGSAKLADLAVITAKIDNLAVNDAKIGNVEVGKLIAGTLSAEVILSGRFRTATSGNRVEFDSAGLRLYRGSTLMGNWRVSDGQIRIYNTTDASHTSTGHAMQFGDTTGQNLIVDDNEILSRNNGSYGPLYLNREGGTVYLGGKIGGFPTDSDTGIFPANADHLVNVRAAFSIYNVSQGDYNDEYPPFLLGRPGGEHLWMDSNEIGATASTGDAVGTLNLQPARNDGSHHVESVIMASGSLGVRRWGTYADGTRSALIYANDASNSTGIRFTDDTIGSGGDRVTITNSDGSILRPLEASNVSLPSSQTVKRNIRTMAAALAAVDASPSYLWEYVPEVEETPVTHIGPMLEDLAAVPGILARKGNPDAEFPADRSPAVSLPSLVGLHHEAIREVFALLKVVRDTAEQGRTAVVDLRQRVKALETR